MSSIGYFTEIEILQNKIKELESKLEHERDEFRETFMRMKANIASISTPSYSSNNYECNPFYEELCFLREENARLTEENNQLKLQQI